MVCSSFPIKLLSRKSLLIWLLYTFSYKLTCLLTGCRYKGQCKQKGEEWEEEGCVKKQCRIRGTRGYERIITVSQLGGDRQNVEIGYITRDHFCYIMPYYNNDMCTVTRHMIGLNTHVPRRLKKSNTFWNLLNFVPWNDEMKGKEILTHINIYVVYT